MAQTEGIILKEIRFKETSKILNIYTRELGKITVMARGAYRPKSRLIAQTQPFAHCDYQLYQGRSWFYINEADLINPFYELREDIERTMYGFYILELLDKSTPEEEKNEKLFLLLEKGLRVLSDLESDFLKFIVAFELKFISFLGYRPSLDCCGNCGNRDLTNMKFSISRGGIICNRCENVDLRAYRINREMYKGMKELLFTELDNLDRIDIAGEDLKLMQNIMEKYILYSIDRKEFNSLKMLKTIISNT